MAEEVENHTIRLLQEMRTENAAFRQEVKARFDGVDIRLDKIEAEQAGMRAEQAGIRVEQAGMSADLKTVKLTLIKVMDGITSLAEKQLTIRELQHVHGSRLNSIDARLALIDKVAGFVKA